MVGMPRTSQRRSSATAEISPELLEQAAGALKRISKQNGITITEPGVRELETGRLASDLADAFHRLATDNIQAANTAGVSWARIGETFGVAAQSVHERFRAK